MNIGLNWPWFGLRGEKRKWNGESKQAQNYLQDKTCCKFCKKNATLFRRSRPGELLTPDSLLLDKALGLAADTIHE